MQAGESGKALLATTVDLAVTMHVFHKLENQVTALLLCQLQLIGKAEEITDGAASMYAQAHLHCLCSVLQAKVKARAC